MQSALTMSESFMIRGAPARGSIEGTPRLRRIARIELVREVVGTRHRRRCGIPSQPDAARAE